MDEKGFTLVEVLVVLAITVVLSGIAIGYSHVGQNQISLSIEESKVAQLILEAKELSIATYSQNSATCAYGVRFDFATSSYSLFEYDSATTTGAGVRPTCPSIASTSQQVNMGAIQRYESGSWQVHTAAGVTLVSSTNPVASATIQYVLFYPPDPCTLISLDGQTFQSACNSGTNNDPPSEANVYLSTSDGSLTRTITINPAGQVSL